MDNKNTNKSEKIKDALVKTKTFALNLPFISHLRVFLDRKSKWEKLYDEANEKFADHEKQDELMLELHRFGRRDYRSFRIEKIREWTHGSIYGCIDSIAKNGQIFRAPGSIFFVKDDGGERRRQKIRRWRRRCKSDLPSSTIPKPPPHLVRSSTETTYQPMDVEGDSLPMLLKDLSERADRISL